VLVTQANASGLDPYTAVKSSERIGQNLAAIVHSSTVFSSVMAKARLDVTSFPSDEIRRRKAWQETVDIEVDPGTGVLSVIAYHIDPSMAKELAMRIAEEITIVTPNYFGATVRAQVIDEPLPSRFFAKPDLLRNAAFGVLLGSLLGIGWVLGRVRKG
jgi:capsular polysaccharide biosynthesis protein